MGNDASQTISLPKGGGALQGIGEKFSADLFTGTANFSVPIEVPAGRNGIQPQLSLGYSSGTGNGPFGLGWNLGVPGIARRTSKGIPRYDDTRDVFILSGAEDLVPIESGPNFTQYRPRTEGMFARITHHFGAGGNYWKVETKDGLTSIYGTRGSTDTPTTVVDPEHTDNIFAWKLSQTTDTFGNVVEYRYVRDDAQLYLSEIRYVDYELPMATTTKFLVSLRFSYEARGDEFSDHRAGFAIRTRRRCSTITVLTQPSAEVVSRTYSFIYAGDPRAPQSEIPLNGVSLLSQIQVTGIDGAKQQLLPPLKFDYTRFVPKTQRFFPVTGPELPAESLAHPDRELVSLFGNGLVDILQMNGMVRYWRNLGNGKFDRPRAMANAPAGIELADPNVQLLDANGDGHADLLVSDQNLSGYYSLNFDGTWNTRSFQKYKFAPSFNLKDPEVRLVDLDGDGITDAVRSGSRMECFFQDSKEGWRETIQVPRKRLEEFPDVNFSDPRIKWADMSGDGMQDIVMVHDGRIDYWPSLGRGEWGRRVTMSGSPKFPVNYDPRRILIGDVDGDGVADIVYVSDRSITLWINQSGNGWSNPIEILGTPPVSDQDSIKLIDLLGTGVSGILWSRDVSSSTRPMFFLDFTSRVKPYLLTHIDNNIGAITRVHYASSTEFYLRDQQQPATRWKTPLPFPVQVVASVETLDAISGNRLTTEYTYHHGYWDGVEREFRGFGRVDQRDTEEPDSSNSGGQPFSHPTETRTWFHQGAVEDGSGDWKATDFRSEFWPGDSQALQQLDPVPDFLKGLTRPVRRDALRALRGTVLRSELYALDGSERQSRPYTVTEQIHGLSEKFLPPSGSTRQHIFFCFVVGQRTTQWERGDDPMTQFAFTPNYDAYGQPRSQIAVAVPRGRDFRVPLTPVTRDQLFLITQSKTDFAQRDDASRYMVDRVARVTSYEIRQQSSAPDSTVALDLYSLLPLIVSGQIVGEVLEQTIHFFDGDPFTGLHFGELGEHGAVVRSEQLVLNEKVLAAAYGTFPSGVPPYFSADGPTVWTADYPQEFRTLFPASAGYIYHPGDASTPYLKGYYAVTDSKHFDFQDSGKARGLLISQLDPLGRENFIQYDAPYSLLPVQVKDAAGLITKAENDYRLLRPRVVTDANGNRGVVTYTPLGLPQTVAIMGKVTETVGDTEAVPGTTYTYNLSSLPVSVRTETRVYHTADTTVDPAIKNQTITTVEYSDGFGRVVQTRSTAPEQLFGDPVFGGGVVPAGQSDPNSQALVVGRLNSDSQNPNVTVSGWQFYDNKGQVTRKFEPFFSVGWQYSAPTQAQLGQSARMFYDPRGHVVRTVNPNGSEQRVVYGIPGTKAQPDLTNPDKFEPTPWETYTYDANDSAGRTHPSESTVYKQHWNTPGSSLIDALGRTIRGVVRNGPNPATDWFTVRTTFDIKGNIVETRDELGRVVVRTVYDLAGHPLRTIGLDAGESIVVMNAAGNPVEARDSKGALSLNSYDILNRPTRVWARDNSSSLLTLRQRMIYGDQTDAGLASPQSLNVLGKLFRHYDEAGLITNQRFDFKGNGLESVRQVIKDAEILNVLRSDPAGGTFQVDWTPATGSDLASRAAVLLDQVLYRTSSTFDALNRPRTILYPAVEKDNQKDRKDWNKRSEFRLQYNRAGALEHVEVNGAVYVKQIAYNAKGQRTLVAYGNGVLNRCAYDPLTFRLLRLRSEKYSSPVAGSYQPAGPVLQDYGYAYDLVGNVLQIVDRTPGSGVLNNPDAALVQDPTLANLLITGNALIRRFTYDPLYRLLSGSGRECSNIPSPRPWTDDPRCGGFGGRKGAPDQDNAAAMTALYQETYDYDPAGNMLALKHAGKSATWVRNFGISGLTPQQWTAEWPKHLGAQDWNNPLSNRLTHVGDNQPAPPQTHSYDACGNLTSETTSRRFGWDHSERLISFRVQASGGAASVQAQYLYDARGQRVKKFVLKQDGSVYSTVYVSSIFEHHSWGSGSSVQENIRLHVMDNQQRIAMVRVGPAHPSDQAPAVQFHLGDHLASSSLVIDDTGNWINREEYTPYGETTFGSFAQKRYRFTGKERDEESGLYYHGARYYAPWVARWTSCDPAGPVDLLNPYVYAKCNPIMRVDLSGKASGENGSNGNSNLPPWLQARIASGVADDRFSKPAEKLDIPERDIKKGSMYEITQSQRNVMQQKKDTVPLRQQAMDELQCRALIQAADREQTLLNTPWQEQVIFDISEKSGGNDMARAATGANEWNEELSGWDRVTTGAKGVGTAASWALPVAGELEALRVPAQLSGRLAAAGSVDAVATAASLPARLKGPTTGLLEWEGMTGQVVLKSGMKGPNQYFWGMEGMESSALEAILAKRGAMPGNIYDVEVQAAFSMRMAGVKEATLRINHAAVCPRCLSNVEQVLQEGQKLTVVDASGRATEFFGRGKWVGKAQ